MVERVVEGRDGSIGRAIVSWEAPSVGDRLKEAANDRLALGGYGLRVGVLVAHHHEYIAVEGELVMELAVASLDSFERRSNVLEFRVVIADQILNVAVCFGVVLESLVVFPNVALGSIKTLLQVLDRLAQSLCADEHISSLGHLELITVLSEQCAVWVKSLNGSSQAWNIRIGRRGRGLTSVVAMLRVQVVVAGIELRVLRDDACLDAGREGNSENFH